MNATLCLGHKKTRKAKITPAQNIPVAFPMKGNLIQPWSCRIYLSYSQLQKRSHNKIFSRQSEIFDEYHRDQVLQRNYCSYEHTSLCGFVIPGKTENISICKVSNYCSGWFEIPVSPCKVPRGFSPYKQRGISLFKSLSFLIVVFPNCRTLIVACRCITQWS